MSKREEYLKKFPIATWARVQLIRWDRNDMVEDICEEHGVGHPNKTWMESKYNKNEDGSYKDSGVHGCCGCCRKKI